MHCERWLIPALKYLLIRWHHVVHKIQPFTHGPRMIYFEGAVHSQSYLGRFTYASARSICEKKAWQRSTDPQVLQSNEHPFFPRYGRDGDQLYAG